MKDSRVLAAINLFSVLRCIEDLVKVDESAKELIKNENLTIKFSVPSLPNFYLRFNSGEVRAVKGGNLKSNINLKFLSVEHFNKMIDGKSNPIPTKGLSKINFLKNEFTKLTDILGTYLMPDEKLLEEDENFRNSSTVLTAFVALFAAVEIGNYDESLSELVNHTPNGNILISVKDNISVTINVLNGKMIAKIGKAENNLAFMEFSSLDILGGILRGTIDTYACIGSGDVSVSGKIPMIDNFNKVLGSVSRYL